MRISLKQKNAEMPIFKELHWLAVAFGEIVRSRHIVWNAWTWIFPLSRDTHTSNEICCEWMCIFAQNSRWHPIDSVKWAMVGTNLTVAPFIDVNVFRFPTDFIYRKHYFCLKTHNELKSGLESETIQLYFCFIENYFLRVGQFCFVCHFSTLNEWLQKLLTSKLPHLNQFHTPGFSFQCAFARN